MSPILESDEARLSSLLDQRRGKILLPNELPMGNKIETVKQLWDKHREFIPDESYPSGVVAVRKAIPGTAFFPGGYGLYVGEDQSHPDRRLRELPILILAHDFHREDTYEKRLYEGWDPRDKTWGNLLKLMRDAKFKDVHRCLFSNVYMGLRKGAKAMGKFPGARDPAFVDLCREFLRLHIQAQQPRLILTLGKPAAMFFAGTAEPSDDERDLKKWRKGDNLWDAGDCKPLLRSVRFSEYTVPAVAALIHPSMLNSNAQYRRYDGVVGRDAELKLLRDAIKAAGLSGA